MSRYQGGIITKSPATPTGPTTTGRAPGIWRMDDVAYWTKQGVWPNANIQAPDASFPYVSLLLSTTALGNANNNLFVDSSGAFNPISRNGNATQGSVTPYSASWSNFFDGSGDYFTVPYTAANFDWYTAGVDFTIEYWFLANSLTGASYVDGGVTKSTVVGNRSATAATDYWSFGPNAGGTVTFYYFNGGPVAVNSSSTITANSWNHIAMTKTSSGITIFVNGVAQTTTAISGTPQSSASFPITVGQGNNTSYNGYVSNLRIVRGTAIYSGNFTPPTQPLTAVTNTTLLTCQSNRFRDASTNNLTLTVTGNTSVTDFSPFAPAYPGISYNQNDITNWSGYFDGTGDYLTVPSNAALNFGTGDFTWEGWIYANSLSNNPFIMHKSTGNGAGTGWFIEIGSGAVYVGPGTTGGTFATFSAASVTTNAWFHLAVTRVGTALTCFVNGTSVGTSTAAGYGSSYDNSAVFAIGGWNPVVSGYDLNGYISNARVVKGSAVYTANFTPPTTNLTAISGTSLLTLQNAAFTDNSTNNFVITPNGNVTVTGNSPFNTVGYWSLYGPSTAGATVPQTTATDLGSGSFTVECWVNLQNYTTDGIVTKRRTDTALTGSWGLFVTTSGFIRFQGVGWATTYTATTNAIPLNTWTHVAVSRSGTNLSVYVNGVRVINATDSYDYTCSTYMIIKLGGNAGGNYPSGGALNGGVTGSISNLRIVQGTAVYNPASTTVTVPTSPLTAISGTSFLTLQNGTMKDNSTNNNTSILLYNSAAAIQPFNPFYTATIASNGGSMYFDGSGDYLSAPSSPAFNLGTANYTVEFFIYTSSTTSQMVFDTIQPGISGGGSNRFYVHTNTSQQIVVGPATNTLTSSSSIQLGAWNHVAVVRSGTTRTIYINGVSAGSSTQSENLSSSFCTIGFDAAAGGTIIMNGYLSNLRVTKGTAVYTANFTPPTAPLTPSANTTLLANGMNAGAYDATAINDMETVGNAQVSTAVSKFGGSSVAFDGSGDGLKFPSNAPMSMGTGNFTWEFWVNPATASAGYKSIIDTRTATLSDGFFFGLNPGTLQLVVVSNVTVLTASTSLTANTWQHVALVRSSGTLTIYLGGTSIGSVANSTNLTSAAGTIGLSDSISNPNPFNGYIDDLRITRGVARYTANFTPPTQAFPPY